LSDLLQYRSQCSNASFKFNINNIEGAQQTLPDFTTLQPKLDTVTQRQRRGCGLGLERLQRLPQR